MEGTITELEIRALLGACFNDDSKAEAIKEYMAKRLTEASIQELEEMSNLLKFASEGVQSLLAVKKGLAALVDGACSSCLENPCKCGR